jgi:hypothetical protein
MDIKFKELQKVTGESRGKKWTAYKIIGIKLEDGSPWESSNIFDNQYNEEILGQCEALNKGDEIAVLHKKNDAGYWQVTGIGEVQDKPDRPTRRSSAGGTKSTSGGSSGGRGLTPDQWAKKDKETSERIARSVALKVANDNTKVGTKPNAVIDMAEEFLGYLLDGTLADDNPFDGGEDGLDPQDIE